MHTRNCRFDSKINDFFFSSDFCQNLHKCVKSGQNLSQLVKSCQKWSKVVENGQKRSKMVRNGQKWSETVRNSQKHLFKHINDTFIDNKISISSPEVIVLRLKMKLREFLTETSAVYLGFFFMKTSKHFHNQNMISTRLSRLIPVNRPIVPPENDKEIRNCFKYV